MRNIWVIAEREYKHYFISPVAYVVMLIVLLFLGIVFYGSVLAASYQQYAPGVEIVIGPMVTVLIFTIPAITMRSLSEESRTGTLELLLTAPVRDWEVVVGKWMGSILFILTLLLITWVYPIVLNQMVSPGIDQGLMLTGYLGLFLLTAAFLAIGVMVSSFFNNQIAAFLATFGLFLVLWYINYPAQAMGSTSGQLLTYLAMSEHLSTFTRGILDLKDTIYYLSVTALALFLGSVSVETRRWR